MELLKFKILTPELVKKASLNIKINLKPICAPSPCEARSNQGKVGFQLFAEKSEGVILFSFSK